MKLLYVEDDIWLRILAEDDVKEARPDIDFLTAGSYGEAARTFVEKGPFDLVVSDREYPGKDPESKNGGADFYQFVRVHAPETPFVVVSGGNAQNIVEQFASRGLAIQLEDIFTKPVWLINVIKAAEKKYLLAPQRPAQATQTTQATPHSDTCEMLQNSVFGPPNLHKLAF